MIELEELHKLQWMNLVKVWGIQMTELEELQMLRRDKVWNFVRMEKLAKALADAESTAKEIWSEPYVNGERQCLGTSIGWGAWALLRADIKSIIEDSVKADEITNRGNKS